MAKNQETTGTKKKPEFQIVSDDEWNSFSRTGRESSFELLKKAISERKTLGILNRICEESFTGFWRILLDISNFFGVTSSTPLLGRIVVAAQNRKITKIKTLFNNELLEFIIQNGHEDALDFSVQKIGCEIDELITSQLCAKIMNEGNEVGLKLLSKKSPNQVVELISPYYMQHSEMILYNTGDLKGENNTYKLLDFHVKSQKSWAIDIFTSLGLNLNHKNSFNETPLYCAIEKGDLDVIKLLVERKAELHPFNFYILLDWMQDNSKKEIIEYIAKNYQLFQDNDPMLTQRTPRDIMGGSCTLLHQACSYGLYNLANLLIEKGSDIEAEARNIYGHPMMPIHFALFSPIPALMVGLLIQRGADVNKVGVKSYNPGQISRVYGYSPLDYAATLVEPECAKILLKAGAKIKNPLRGGVTPFMNIFDNLRDFRFTVSLKTAEFLLNNGEDVNEKWSGTSNFRLSHAVAKYARNISSDPANAKKLEQLFIEFGVSINFTDRYPKTPKDYSVNKELYDEAAAYSTDNFSSYIDKIFKVPAEGTNRLPLLLDEYYKIAVKGKSADLNEMKKLNVFKLELATMLQVDQKAAGSDKLLAFERLLDVTGLDRNGAKKKTLSLKDNQDFKDLIGDGKFNNRNYNWKKAREFVDNLRQVEAEATKKQPVTKFLQEIRSFEAMKALLDNIPDKERQILQSLHLDVFYVKSYFGGPSSSVNDPNIPGKQVDAKQDSQIPGSY